MHFSSFRYKIEKTSRKLLAFIFIFSILINISSANVVALETNNVGKPVSTIAANTDSQVISVNSYEEYYSKISGYSYGSKAMIINAVDTSDSMKTIVKNKTEYNTDKDVLYTSEDGYAEWTFEVDAPGLYNIAADYYSVSGRSANIERELSIDGKIPFTEASHITFQRMWQNDLSGYKIVNGTKVFKMNKAGNDIIPEQVEHSGFQRQNFDDASGYYNGAFAFYFSKGKHTIRLTSTIEPCVLKSIILYKADVPATYAEYSKRYQNKTEYTREAIKIQGESADYKSDTMISLATDRASADTEPQDAMKSKLNTIGGSNWGIPKQWIVWNINVPEDGLYKIDMRVRQNIKSGISSSRSLFIDGNIPFKECSSISVKYNSNWQIYRIGDGKSNYLFYLSKGNHIFKLQVTIGEVADDFRTAQKIVKNLNNAYRKIIMLTGRTPDPYRDYHIEKAMPEVISTFKTEATQLRAISNHLLKISGKRGSTNAVLDNLALQLKSFIKDPLTITSRLNDFSGNISALGNWVLDVTNQPLEIDYIELLSPTESSPKVSSGFLNNFVFQTKSFIGSFIQDYSLLGFDSKVDKKLNIWVQTGRDQAQVINSLIQKNFTTKYAIGVDIKIVSSNLMLTNMSQLLSATVAGLGPDVALMMNNLETQNYASRGALHNIGSYSDFSSIIKRFNNNAMIPFTYNGGYYALPETQSCLMTFYRTDIFKELGLSVPKSWDDVYELIGKLQKNNLEFGIPGGSTDADMYFYGTLLNQFGGQFYTNDQKKSALDSKIALACFKMWTELYSNYGVPIDYDAQNRFRTGEMPIVLADSTFYNNLSVFAPELKGEWSFVTLPGVRQPDGAIKNDSATAGLCCFMLEQSKSKDAAWEFMKWWTSTGTQISYGRGIESIQGAAARYPSANMEALKSLPWNSNDMKTLLSQLGNSKPNPEVPGGYYTGRYIENALREVLSFNVDPRETLLDYVTTINDEIHYKRQEFGLAN